jgi:4-amino-4-deoxy-L-arabinose transferase-like glycosyltransferase
MSASVSNPSIAALPAVDSVPSPLFTIRLLRALSRFVNAHGWIVFTAVSLACGWLRLSAFTSRPLDHDELYTFYIAQAPTLKALLALTRSIDLHPPLSYLLIRASFSVFGIHAWSCRLPSVLACFIAVSLLFWMMKQILSPLYGIVSVLLFWSVPYTYQADEARPYSLLLCFTTLMLVGWYRATAAEDSGLASDSRWASLLALTAGGFGLLLSHVLGILPYAVFIAAEFIRSLVRRKLDWRVWVALLIPVISGLTYLPLLRTHASILFTNDYRPGPLRLLAFYCRSLSLLVVPLLTIVLLAISWPLVGKTSAQKPLPPHALRLIPAITPSLFCILCGLSLVPLGVGVLFEYTGTAFFDRYGIVVLIPIACLPTLFLGIRSQRDQMAGLAVMLVLGASFVLNTSGKVWLIEQLGSVLPPGAARYVINVLTLPPIISGPVKPRISSHLQSQFNAALPISNLDAVEPNLPLVAGTGLTFLELDQRADSELAKRLYLLNDLQAAKSIAHDTVFENYDRLTKVFPIRGKVLSYCAFIGQHPHFVVVGAYNHPQGWLLRKLDMDGADLRIIGTYGGITEEAQVYDANVLDTNCPNPF